MWNSGERGGLFQMELMKGEDKNWHSLAAIVPPKGKTLRMEPKQSKAELRGRECEMSPGIQPASIASSPWDFHLLSQ